MLCFSIYLVFFLITNPNKYSFSIYLVFSFIFCLKDVLFRSAQIYSWRIWENQAMSVPHPHPEGAEFALMILFQLLLFRLPYEYYLIHMFDPRMW